MYTENMLTVWQELIVVFGGNAALLALLALLLRSLLTHRLDKDLKVFEAELKAKSDCSIEQLKGSLQIAAVEHQVRFSNLHEKRAEVIAELYKALVESFWAAHSFVSLMEWSGEPSKQDKYVDAVDKIRRLFIFVETHRIYLPESVCSLLDTFVNNVRSPVTEFGVYISIQYPTDRTLKEKMDVWVKAWKAFEEEIPKTRQALEVEFRRVLGGA